MSGRTSKRVSFSPEDKDKPTLFLKQSFSAREPESMKGMTGIWTFRLSRESRISPVRFLRRLGTKVAKAIRYVSTRRRPSRKVSASSLTRSRSVSDCVDSHRAEAIEDCIEFLNSSSSLSRSNSVTGGFY